MTSSERDVALQKARRLREDWRTWAWKHREELRRLKLASASDQDTLIRVWNQIPFLPNREETGIDWRELAGSNPKFNWNGMGKHPGYGNVKLDAKAQNRIEEGKRTLDRQLEADFAAHHDIQISESLLHSGTTHYTLWASGRITETDTRVDTSGAEPARISVHREVEPPYDFLR